MAQIKSAVSVDLRAFNQSLNKLINKEYPDKLARGFATLAEQCRDEVRAETKRKFKLHSPYIPKGVLSIPHSEGQIKSAARSIRRKGDLMAAVLLRPARTPKNDLSFMVSHETGADKRPHGGDLAVPGRDIKRLGFKTSKGKVKKRWKPAELLKEFNRLGGNRKGSKLQRKSKSGKTNPYLFEYEQGRTAIVRRIHPATDKLLFLYHLKDKASIKPRWSFEPTVHTTATRKAKSTITKYINKATKN